MPRLEPAPHRSQSGASASILRCVVAHLEASEVGPRLDLTRIADQLRVHWRAWFQPPQLDLRALYGALLRTKGVEAEQLYLPFENIRRSLGPRGIELLCPRAFVESDLRDERLRLGENESELARRRFLADRRAQRGSASSTQLGALLVEKGQVNESDLQEALWMQERFGGRLGHHLVLQGVIDNEGLASSLGQLHGCLFISGPCRPSKAVVGELSRELLRRYPIVPVERPRKGALQLALPHPGQPGLLEELEEAFKLKIEPIVCPEHVLHLARARFFRMPYPGRLFEPRPVGDVDLSDGAETLVGLQVQSKRIDLSHYVRAFLECDSEDEVAERAFGIWAKEFGSSAHFFVDRGDMVGVGAFGLESEVEKKLRGARLPIRGHWLFSQVVERREVYTGPGSAEVGTTWITDCLGLPPAAHLSMVPIQGPLGRVRSVLVGNHSHAWQNEARLRLLRGSIRAAMRFVQARQALHDLLKYDARVA